MGGVTDLEKIKALFDAPISDVDVVYLFDDAAVIKELGTGEFFTVDCFESGNGEVSFKNLKIADLHEVTSRFVLENPNASVKSIKTAVECWERIGDNPDACIKEISALSDIDNPEALYGWVKFHAEYFSEELAGKSQVEDGLELTGPIVFKNALKRIAYAAVLVPGEKDSDGESVTAEKIEEAAHEWMEHYRNVDFQHSLNNVGIPVETYLLPMEMAVKALDGETIHLPKGSWILGSRLNAPTFELVEKGDLTGYSIMGIKRTALKSAGNDNEIMAAMKKTLLRDLGKDWVPAYVSVVNRPAVPKAKFFALKAEEPSWLDKIKNILSSKKSTKKEVLESDMGVAEKLKGISNSLSDLLGEVESGKSLGGKEEEGGDFDMTEEEVRETVLAGIGEAVKSAVEEAVSPIKSELEALKADFAGKGQEEGEKAGVEEGKKVGAEEGKKAGAEEGKKEEGAEAEESKDLEAFKSEVNEKLKALSKKLGVDSAALKGQDGDEKEEPGKNSELSRSYKSIERDIYGRRIQS